MTNDEKLAIFRAQTENVRAFNSAWRAIKRSIHIALVKDDFASAQVHTRVLALTYCAWAEAIFSKVIHTPYGFDAGEIEQVKLASKDGISSSWRKCIELSLLRVKASKAGHLPNIAQSLNRLVQEFVEKPSLLRNKIAHGQIVVALNRDNTAINTVLTAEIADLDVVKIDRLHQAMQGLSDIIESIIESPQKGAFRNYWTLSQAVVDKLDATTDFTLTEKILQLKQKRARTTIIGVVA